MSAVYLGENTLDSGQGEDVADVFTSLAAATTNGNAVCYITMRAHLVSENILAKEEAFVWGGGGFHCEVKQAGDERRLADL